MSIKTLLKLSITLALTMVMGLAVSNWFVAARLNRIADVEERAQAASFNVSKLLVLTHEYVLYSEERAEQQWRAQQAALVGILEAGTRDVVPVAPASVAEAVSLADLFQKLTTVSSGTTDLQIRQKKLLIDQLLANTQRISDSVHHWGATAHNNRKRLDTQLHLLTIVVIPGLIFLILIALSAILNRRVLQPLSTLHRAVQAVARGDLTVRSATSADDELGELSRTFDAMAVDLVTELRQEIRERKHAEERLSLEKIASESANTAKSQFLANMSHEIRTPMNGVIGMTQLLRFTQLTEEQLDYLKNIEMSAGNLLSIINDILDLSKIESGRLELENADFSMRQCIQAIVVMQKSKAVEKGLKIETNYALDLPEQLHGDQLRFKQILLNLLNNAVKFTEKGWITIEADLLEQKQDCFIVRIVVSDSGIGISSDALERVFDPFTQADASTTRRFGGTGLGLAICRQLAELMGGRIWAESEEGHGSRFYLELPFYAAKEPVISPAEPTVEKTATAENTLNVLVADDNRMNQLTTILLLKKIGHHAQGADNGKTAVERWQAGGIDLILMDIQMPVLNGMEALQAIRSKEPAGQHTPIIALTADALKGTEERLRQAGFDGYLSKPVLIEQLQDLLRQVSAEACMKQR